MVVKTLNIALLKTRVHIHLPAPPFRLDRAGTFAVQSILPLALQVRLWLLGKSLKKLNGVIYVWWSANAMSNWGNRLQNIGNGKKSPRATRREPPFEPVRRNFTAMRVRLAKKNKLIHCTKYNDILSLHDVRTYVQKKNGYVVNISGRKLNKDEVTVLRKGLNFSITPNQVPKKGNPRIGRVSHRRYTAW